MATVRRSYRCRPADLHVVSTSKYRGWIGAALAIAFLTTPTAKPAEAQSTAARSSVPPLNDSLVGRDSFQAYCASCHGRAGRGDGPVAGALKTRPADLTDLARRNDGAFPRDRVAAVLDGRGGVAHGTTDMPVWGAVFRAVDSDARTKQRLQNLLAYVETLQAPSTAPNAQGSQLFRAYCASCHGPDGRGSGPMAGQLRRAPPDLTTFTQRNGGVFPGERVRRIIDGREVASHGDRTMPVWGDAFMRGREGLSEDAIRARIDAIVTYLQGIQRRPA